MAKVYVLDQRDELKLQQQINKITTDLRVANETIIANKEASDKADVQLKTNLDTVEANLKQEISDLDESLTKYIDDTKLELQADIDDNALDIASNAAEIVRVESGLTSSITSTKSELQNNIDTEKAARIAADTEEQTRAETAESGLDNRLKVVENDLNTFLKDADLTENAKDTLREIQDYITSDVDAAGKMTANIQANATAITNEQTRATGVESGLNTRLTTAEGEIDALQTKDTELEASISTLKSDLETDIDNFASDLNDDIVELRNTKVNVSDIVNNLTSTDAVKPLSANQGYVLNNSISSLSTKVDNSISSLSTEIANYLPLTGGTITGDVTLSESDLYAADLYATDLYFTENGGAMGQIYGKTPDGNYVANIQPCNESGNCVIGFGNYSNGSGATNIYGAEEINMVLAGCTGRVFNARNDYGNMEINRSGYADENSKTYIYGTDVHLVTVDGYEAYKNEMPIVANKVLYSDSTGTAGEVKLSETAANFDYLEVYVKANGLSSSSKVCDPDGSTVAVHVHGGDDAGDCLFYGNWTVSGTTMTCNVNNTYNYADGTYAPTATNELYIVKVVGYK